MRDVTLKIAIGLFYVIGVFFQVKVNIFLGCILYMIAFSLFNDNYELKK